jgi:tetratricopeptide (TPR) repeat protein
MLCALLALSLFASCVNPAQPLSTAELLDLGEKYLLELNYEQALVQFLRVIEVEPRNPRGYTGAAEAYIGLGDTDAAIVILRQGLGQLPDNADIQSILSEILPSESESIPDLLPTPEPNLTLENQAEQGISVGLPVLHMMDDTLFAGIWEVTVSFNDSWAGPTTHTAEDFSNITIYVNGTPNPVFIERFIEHGANSFGLIITSEEDAFTRFAQYPATYQVSLNIHGIDIPQDKTSGVIVNSDRTWDWLSPAQ